MDWVIIIIGFFVFLIVAAMLSRSERSKKNKKMQSTIDDQQLLSDQIDERLGIKKDRQSSSDAPKIDNAQARVVLEFEFPRHKQILEESIQLIQDTNNLDTLLFRYDIALENAHWIMEQKAKGLPIYFDTEEGGFENSLNKINNYHIVRIAMDRFINYKKKMYGLKTSKAKDNNTAQMFEFIEKCRQSLRPHTNKLEFEDKLNRLHNNTEDFYSKI